MRRGLHIVVLTLLCGLIVGISSASAVLLQIDEDFESGTIGSEWSTIPGGGWSSDPDYTVEAVLGTGNPSAQAGQPNAAGGWVDKTPIGPNPWGPSETTVIYGLSFQTEFHWSYGRIGPWSSLLNSGNQFGIDHGSGQPGYDTEIQQVKIILDPFAGAANPANLYSDAWIPADGQWYDLEMRVTAPAVGDWANAMTTLYLGLKGGPLAPVAGIENVPGLWGGLLDPNAGTMDQYVERGGGYAWQIDDIGRSIIPEPSTIAMLGLGLVAFVARRRRG